MGVGADLHPVPSVNHASLHATGVRNKRRVANRPITNSRPYVGDIAGASWNSQSLCCLCKAKKDRKRLRVASLLKQNDFVCTQETFATKGYEKGYRLPPNTTAWWSHDTDRARIPIDPTQHAEKRKGGIAIFAQNSFLSNFTSRKWIELIQGRVGVLRLLGPEGNLDIWNVYMPASDTQLRQKCIASLAKNIQPADITLSIIVGDWNFTMHRHDRITKKDATWTGDSQSKEAGIFTKQVLTTHNFHEIFQPLHTHEDGLVRSRLDRVYINHHPTDFLDKDIRAWVHSFPYEISHHRTLLFCRKSKPKRTKALGVCSPLPLAGVTNHHDFRNKVENNWQDNRDRLICLTPLQQLGEFKKVMRRAAYELADRRGNLQPTLHEDRLNACMRLIRAMEGKDRVTCNKILSSNTELAALAAGKLKNRYSTLFGNLLGSSSRRKLRTRLMSSGRSKTILPKRKIAGGKTLSLEGCSYPYL